MSGNPKWPWPDIGPAFRPKRTVAKDWRGAQVWAIDGELVTVRVQAEVSYMRDYRVTRDLFPADAVPAIGAPCIVRVANVGAPLEDYLIVAVRSAGFADPVTDHEASVARGEFHPGAIPYDVTGEDKHYDWDEYQKKKDKPAKG